MQIGHDGEHDDDPAETLTVKLRGKDVVVHILHHARQRMVQRRISLDELLAVLEYPTSRNLPTEAGRKRFGRQDAHRGRRLDVVFEESEDGSIVVITTHWNP